METTIFSDLSARGLIQESTPGFEDFLKVPRYVYAGFDLTADALHLGNLLILVTLLRFQQYGHRPIVLLGGATTKIGDPEGKDRERPLLSLETIASNKEKIRSFLKSILGEELIFVDNSSWFDQMTVADYLRDIGRFFRLGTMLSRDSVRLRMQSQEGMSYTEFSYPLLQGYDFFHLRKTYGPLIQIGGSDQWGNMVSGVEFSRRMGLQDLAVMTVPLILRKDGKKFGKSEEGAIYLSKERTSAYHFYQYLWNLPDDDVTPVLKKFTRLSIEEIEALEGMERQKKLAEQLTLWIHGQEGLANALRLTEVAFSGTVATKQECDEIFYSFPHATVLKESWLGKSLVELLAYVHFISSKSEGVRAIQQGGIRFSGKKVEDPKFIINKEHLIGDTYLFVQQGKKEKIIIKFE